MNDYKLLIKFDNGEVKLFDAKKLFSRKAFIPTKNKALFGKVKTNGVTLEWVKILISALMNCITKESHFSEAKGNN